MLVRRRGGVAIFDPGVVGGERLRLRIGGYRRGVEVESFQALPGRQPRFGEMGGPRDCLGDAPSKKLPASHFIRLLYAPPQH